MRRYCCPRTYFYPRPPRGGRPDKAGQIGFTRCISIHALREEGDSGSVCEGARECISIHALREEGDARGGLLHFVAVDFYPRPPRGGRQGRVNICRHAVLISIHALREEGDL